MSAESVVRDLYARIAVGDFPGVVELLSEDVVFVQAASLPFGGEWRGHDGFVRMAERITAAWPGFQAAPRVFLESGSGEVAVVVQLTGDGLDMPMIELWTVSGDRITRCQPFYFDTGAAARTARDVQS